MKKQSIGVAGALLCLMVFATSVLADNTIQLWVNHSQVKSDVEPQIVDGRVMVPLRAVAEALGAKVEWDEKNRSISIQTQQQATTEQQIALLEQAVAAKTPKEAAETWVKGVQTRNGALQYAVLSPE
ncbi:MAG: copper amine oxidase N-terminal domain-containing protein [Clostridia bacterium]